MVAKHYREQIKIFYDSDLSSSSTLESDVNEFLKNIDERNVLDVQFMAAQNYYNTSKYICMIRYRAIVETDYESNEDS